MDLKFRLLKPNEIECRINTINEKGLSLLLYKTARTDANLLDETVGPMNWQRFHSRDNANCTVSIWDEDKKQWVSKEDVGTESYSEAEKGLASDSFKRACFSWGIGRELYSAPFIYIPAKDCSIKERNGKYTCYDDFTVSEIEYDADRCISKLAIKNGEKIVWTMDKGISDAPAQKLGKKYITSLQKEIERTHTSMKSLLNNYGAADLSALTFEQYKDAMAILEKKPDFRVEVEPNSGEDDYMPVDYSDLPWNQ